VEIEEKRSFANLTRSSGAAFTCEVRHIIPLNNDVQKMAVMLTGEQMQVPPNAYPNENPTLPRV